MTQPANLRELIDQRVKAHLDRAPMDIDKTERGRLGTAALSAKCAVKLSDHLRDYRDSRASALAHDVLAAWGKKDKDAVLTTMAQSIELALIDVVRQILKEYMTALEPDTEKALELLEREEAMKGPRKP